MSCSGLSESGSPNKSTTPEKSFRIGPDRVALLTGTYKRPKPYPDAAERRVSLNRGTRPDLDASLASLPATRAVLAAMRSPSSPLNTSVMNKSSASTLGDLNVNIKRAAIDWKLANREAEVYKLKTDISRLESDLRDRREEEVEQKIQFEKEIAKLEVEKQSLAAKVRNLEQEVENLKCELNAQKERETELKTAFLPEKESLENTIVQLKVNDCDLHAKLFDAEETIKSLKLAQDQDRLKLTHEIKCLNLELESVKTDRQLLQQTNSTLSKEVEQMQELRRKVSDLENENSSLKTKLQNYEESEELKRLFREEMDQVKALREENDRLKQQLEQLQEEQQQQQQQHHQPLLIHHEVEDEPPAPSAAVSDDGHERQDDLMSEEEEEYADAESSGNSSSSSSASSEYRQVHADDSVGDDRPNSGIEVGADVSDMENDVEDVEDQGDDEDENEVVDSDQDAGSDPESDSDIAEISSD